MSRELPVSPTARRWVWALVLLAASGVASLAATTLIEARFPDRPMPRDLLLDALPYSLTIEYVADAAVMLAMLIVLVHYARKHASELPKGITLYALVYALRAPLTLMTPLASPHGGHLYGFLPPQAGMFPSGHSANVLMCFFLMNRDSAPRLRWVVLALAFTEWTALLLSRGHYTIDVAGGLLLSYFVYTEWRHGRLFEPFKRIVGA